MPLLSRREDPHDRRGHRRGAAARDRARPGALTRRFEHDGRRALAIWALLFAAYASTLGLHAVDGHQYGRDETRYLLTVRSLADQHDFDVSDEYRARAWRDFGGTPVRPDGRRRKGALYEPHAIGLPVVAAPFYALGGAKVVELVVAALLALALAWSYLLARRVVPDPWCAGAVLALGLSPPLVAYATAVLPEPMAAAPLAGGALCAVRLRSHVSRRSAFGCLALLGAVPWLAPKLVPAAVVIGIVAVAAIRRARRGLLALASVEVASFSVALLVGLNEALFGGPTPHAVDVAGTSATGASTFSDYVGRAWRLPALFLDKGYGLVRWAPVAALAFAGAWLLYRAGRERLARAIAGIGEEHAVARLCAAAVFVTALVAAFFVPRLNTAFPTRELIAVLPLTAPLVALGLRQAPRIGALLGLLGLGGSVWLWVAVRTGGALLTDRARVPWGPVTDVFPRFAGGVWPYALLAAVLLAVAAPVIREELELRRRLP